MTEQRKNGVEASVPACVVGVIADTHIPDRVRTLHPQILPLFQEARVSYILHAGDISTREVLENLRQVAPVTAVLGNRDLFAGPLRLVEELEICGVRLALLHGHGGWIPYLWDKWKFILFGYRLERYLPRLLRVGRNAQVVVFGHTHHTETIWREGKLLYNPGSASFGLDPGIPPAIGLLSIYPDGSVKAQTLPLSGYVVQDRNWVKAP